MNWNRLKHFFMRTFKGIISDMEINPYTLKFEKKLENDFKKEYFHITIDFVRLTLFLSVVIYISFYFLDRLVFPEYKSRFLLIRLIVCLPLSFSVLAFSYFSFFRRIWQAVMFIIIQLAALGITLMILHAKTDLQVQYFAGLALALIFNFIFTKLSFVNATISGWLIYFIFIVSVSIFTDISSEQKFLSSYFLIGTILFGMAANYLLEVYYRREYILKLKLEKEKDNLDNLNANLEKMVESRTSDLHELNRVLKEKNEVLQISEAELAKHKKNLELLVKDRTNELQNRVKELDEKNKELERFNQLFVNREFRIKELKEELKKFKESNGN
jgi:hypothetical protein